MNIEYSEMAKWPKLAWLARCAFGINIIEVFHGNGIETHDNWFCEAVWDGPFHEGAFDRTDIVAGSGGRLRDGRMVFVSSGATVDRIQSISAENSQHWVSNSLPCLLTAVNGSVAPGYDGYWEDFGTIINGIDVYKKHIQSNAGDVQLVYFNNLVWDGQSFKTVSKPGAARKFESFADYYEFLKGSMEAISTNMVDSGRSRKYELFGTLSSGYDSTAVTALAVSVGCTEALSFTHARGGEPDDGDEAAEALGIKLHRVERENWKKLEYPEIPFIAADAKAEDRYLRAAEDLLSGKVLITGFHGDKIWDKHTENKTSNIVRGDRSGLSLTEYRLRADFIHCPIAFWGVRQINDVVRISNSDEMKLWDVEGNYSRPICRRISEQAGIPREAFGMRKRAASEQPFASPEFLTPSSMEDFLRWAKAHRWQLVRDGRLPVVVSQKMDRFIFTLIGVAEKMSGKLSMILSKTPILWRSTNTERFISVMRKLRNAKTFAKPMYLRKFLFPWALEKAKRAYPMPPEFRA